MVYAAGLDMIRKLATAGLAACALLSARPAAAFLVVGTDAAQAPGPDTRVLVLREDARSVVALAPTIRGPAKPLAVVVPLPRAAAASLRAAPVTVFERTEALAAPRIDELWELDPCELHPNQQSAPPSPSASAAPSAEPAAPRTEGDYEITVLPDLDAKGATRWLADHGYRVPDGAEAALAAALRPGTALAIARIDGGRLTFEKEVARLPPLAFVADGPLDLPLSLASVGAPGPHETIVDVLSPRARLEAANLVNIGVPTNLDVIEDARSDRDGLHRANLDFTFERTPGAAITEYAWLAANCDGCESGKGLGAEDVLALGAGALPSAEDGSQREVMVDVAEALSRAPEGPPDLKRAIVGCYGKTLREMAGLEGSATITVQTGEGGAVTSAKIKDASAEALGKCVEDAARPLKLDHANATGTVQVRFALVSRAYLGGMVFTRLRVRGAKAASADLSLRAAAPIEGGREEGPTGEPEKKVYFADHANNFRARYVVRHPWSGPIACEDPKRGVWSARPPGGSAPSGKPGSRPSQTGRPSTSSTADASGKPAAPSAAEQKLAAYLVGGALPELQPYAITFRAAEPPRPSPAPAASGAPPSGTTPPAASSSGPAGAGGGCGCRAAPEPGSGLAWAAITAVMALAARGRRRRR